MNDPVALLDAETLVLAAVSPRRRKAIGDILIAATACAAGIPLVSRNRRDFQPFARVVDLELVSWVKQAVLSAILPTIRLPVRLLTAAERLAARRRLSFDAVVRLALETMMAADKRQEMLRARGQ